jgi:hypothetical protein
MYHGKKNGAEMGKIIAEQVFDIENPNGHLAHNV